jgi:hypothetical protein
MTMFKWMGTAAAAGLVILFAGGQRARADDDTVRLGANIEATTTTLGYDGLSDTMLTRGARGFVGYRGGHHGFYGGHRGFYGGHRGFYGGYRGFYGGYRGFYGGYRGFYGGYRGYGYGPYYAGYYGPGYYSSYGYGGPAYYPNCAPGVYYTPGYSYYPISVDVEVGQAPTYRPGLYVQGQQQQPFERLKVPVQPAEGGTFPYDGGPANPIPLPKDGQAPIYQPLPKTLPADGRLVSLPAAQQKTLQERTGFAYPAYGDRQQTTTFASDRSGTTAVATKKKQ